MSSIEKTVEEWNSSNNANEVHGMDGDRGFTAGPTLDSLSINVSTKPQQANDVSNKVDDTDMDNAFHLPSIPVAMRHPHVVSSVKQYRTEHQQQQLQQPFVSEAFISMTPNVTKPPRKRRRPPFSYSSLIAQAILETENERLTLREIYQWIVQKYPSLYGANDVGWQNTIRHNLSLNRCFKKIPKEDSETSTKGKGGYWTIDPNHMMKFKNGAFVRGSSSTLRRKPTYSMNTHQEWRSTYTQQEQQHLSPSSSSAPSTRSPSPSLLNALQPIGHSLQQKPPSPHTVASMTSSFRLSDPSASSTASSSCTVMNIHNLLN